jgi:trans-AT polyketide synthase, acyltransferase and oxidoreductase domains
LATDLLSSISITITPEALGSSAFRRAHGVRYAYVAGAMYQGIASPELVVRMARSELLSYLGTGGLTLGQIENALARVKADVPGGRAFGANLLHQPDNPLLEQATVDLYQQMHVNRVEAAAYLDISPALAEFRLAGITSHGGKIESSRQVLAKVSRPEVARHFLSPAPPAIVTHLRNTGKLTQEQALAAAHLPLADDVCVESDSGGHTDQGVAFALLPTILQLRDRVASIHPEAAHVRIGAAGGLGTPHALAAAFILGADFVLTGSINQCTIETGASSRVKDMLQRAGPQDTVVVPAGDMLEIGGKMQVLKRGLLFPARAVKLYELYRDYTAWEEIPAETRRQIEARYFRRRFEEIIEELRLHYQARSPERWAEASRNPRQLLGMVCRWYFHNTTQWALAGDPEREVDYQIHCGPALGSFNSWVEGTPLTDWRERHVDDIAERLMTATAQLLSKRFEAFAQ